MAGSVGGGGDGVTDGFTLLYSTDNLNFTDDRLKLYEYLNTVQNVIVSEMILVFNKTKEIKDGMQISEL